jgi:hypothetical protein
LEGGVHTPYPVEPPVRVYSGKSTTFGKVVNRIFELGYGSANIINFLSNEDTGKLQKQSFRAYFELAPGFFIGRPNMDIYCFRHKNISRENSTRIVRQKFGGVAGVEPPQRG